MEYQDVILNREKGWIEITINRPEKLNSLRETDRGRNPRDPQ